MNVKTAEPPICRQTAPNRVLNFKKFPGVTPSDPHTLELCPRPPGRGKGGKGEGERGKVRGRRERDKERGREGSEEKG